jgi:hypothetical protein
MYTFETNFFEKLTKIKIMLYKNIIIFLKNIIKEKNNPVRAS